MSQAVNMLQSIAHLMQHSLYRKMNFFRYWKIANFAPGSNLIGLTYANDKHTDGAGAQLQRIYGIYAIARFLKVAYIHSPLTKVGYKGLAALEENSAGEDIVSEYNSAFRLPSDIELPKKLTVRYLETVNLKTLERLEAEASKNKTFTLVQIAFPYRIIDVYPELYEVVKEISPFPFERSPVIRIAVHVRRGELFAVDSYRMLPNDYYIAVMQRIRAILDDLNLKCEFELYTELPKKVFIVTPTHHGICERISDPVVVDPKLNKIEDFDLIPDLTKFINTDPIETLQRMASANILITSHSSFSYLSAILNMKGTIIYNRFWHNPLRNWLISDDSGHFSKKKFLKQLGESYELEGYNPFFNR